MGVAPQRSEGFEGMAMGYTEDDRRRFERVDLRVEDILKGMEDLRSRFRDVEVDIDELRGGKADKSELGGKVIGDHETRLRLVEASMSGVMESMRNIEKELQLIQAWRWKAVGAFAVIIAVVNFLANRFLKF
jgi:hypothetical protein